MKPTDTLTRKAVEAASKHPEYKELLSYLTARQKVPALQSRSLPEGTRAMYVVPGFTDPDYNEPTIVLDQFYAASSSPARLANTMLHEMAHAGRSTMTSQYLTAKPGPQFKAGYEKLVQDLNKKYSDPGRATGAAVTKAIAPEFYERNKNYRTSLGDGEIASHGLGNTVTGTGSNPAPPHVDATAATEFMILLDLAMRDAQSKQKDKK